MPCSVVAGSAVPSPFAICHLLFAIGMISLLTGCTVITYTAPTGETFRRTSFGTQTAISSLSVEAGDNGVRKVTLRGYSSDQVESLGVITEAAVAGAVKGLQP